MANGLLDYISGFGATPPEYMGGLLGQEAVDKLKGRAATTGIANAVLGYLAAPKNQNLGLGRIIGQSLQAGMTGAQGVYDTALQDWQTKQKIDEMNRQKAQREAFDVAAKGLYTTTPAQYATEQISGGGYLPQTPDANAVAPNFGLSKTYAPATTQQIMTAPASQELSQEALNAMILSGDPRATSYLTGLKTLKDITTPAKVDLVNIAEGGSVYDPNQGKIVAYGTPKPNLGTTKKQDYDFYAQQETASGRQPKSFGEWDMSIESARAPKSTTTIKLPPREQTILDVDQDTLKGLTGGANASRNVAAQTRVINSLIGNQQGNGLIKLNADLQNFLGVKSESANVNQAIQGIATIAATGIKTPGSGSTSDLEFGAYRSSFPTLATSKEGRELMAQIADANARRMSKLADWARKNVGNNTFSYEGLAEYDNSLGRAVSVEIENRVKRLSGAKGGVNQDLLNQADAIIGNP
jgi:hypothetical protein